MDIISYSKASRAEQKADGVATKVRNIPDAPVALVNAIPNTAFETTTGWTPSSSNISVVSNEMTVAATSTNTSFSVSGSPSPAIPGNAGKKIYIRMKFSTPHEDCTSLQVRMRSTGTTSGTYYVALTINTPSADSEYVSSGVATLSSALAGDVYPLLLATFTAQSRRFKFKEFTMLDLTAIFGAGKEPTAAQMDAWFTEHGWFPGSADYIEVGLNDGKIVSARNGELVMVDFPSFGSWYGKSFISLGDSITWQDGKNFTTGPETGQLARGFQTVLKEKLGFTNHVNAAVSGRPMANGTAPGVGTNTTGKSQNYAPHDLVIIAAGTNDFGLDVPLGTKGLIGDTTFDTNTFYGAYRDLIEYILTQKPSIRIVLFTPLQRSQAGYDVNFTNPAGHKLIDYVDAIKEIGKMYSLPVCDMYANSSFTKLTLATFTRDNLHPNNTGYARMGDYAVKFVSGI